MTFLGELAQSSHNLITKSELSKNKNKFLDELHTETELNKIHIEGIKQKIIEFEAAIVYKSDFIDFKSRAERDYHIAQRHIVDIEENIKKTQNFIEKQIPLDYTKAISE